MIFFTGCSFTFCEGLYYYKWLKEGTLEHKSQIYADGNPKEPNIRCWTDDDSLMTEDDYSWLELNGWPAMVSKKLNTSFFKDRRNGGNNQVILKNLPILQPHIPKPKLIVIQWTDWTRHHDLEHYVKTSQNPERDIVNFDWKYFGNVIEPLDIPCIFVDWLGTYYKYSPDRWKDNFVSYGDSYSVIEKLMEENNTLTYDESIGKIKNEHLNMNGNRILSDIVVEKIKEININLDGGFSFFNIDKSFSPIVGYHVE